MNSFPKQIKLKNQQVSLSLMSALDAADILEFAADLSAHDQLFLRRDILQPEVVEGWVKNIEADNTISVLARGDGDLMGYGTLNLGSDWSSHVAELRVMVGADHRQSGVGRALVRELFRLAVTGNIEKVFARMTLDQTGARKLFQELGFRPEALLANEVRDRNGNLHDVLSMAVNVDAFLERRDRYGLS